MILPRSRLLRVIFIAALLVLLADAFWIYILKFPYYAHSDTAVTVLMAARMVAERRIIANDWYYANGDVWVWAPQMLATLPVAIGGVNLTTLRITEIFGFFLELGVITACFRRLTRRMWVAVLAAAAMLLVISKLNVLFVYVELSYGFVAATNLAIFTLLSPATASTPKDPLPRAVKLRWAAGALFLFVVSLQNPPRIFVFDLAPLLVACLWPWRGMAIKARATLAVLALGSWGAAVLVYKTHLAHTLTFSPYPGHSDFVIRDLAGIWENVKMFGRGLIAISGDLDARPLPAIVGLFVTAGVFGFGLWQLFARRTLTRARFLYVVCFAQLSGVLIPCLAGNLLLNPLSARYLQPSFLSLFGLAVVTAARQLGAPSRTTALRWAWLAAIPLAAAIGFFRVVGSGTPLEGVNMQWANRPTHADVAAELTKRGLQHGFASYWNANLITLLASAKTRTCPVFFHDGGINPQKWNIDSGCFDRAAMPAKIYVVAEKEEIALTRRAVAKVLPEPIERFTVADTFEVMVFDVTHDTMSWLDLPLPHGAALKFPLPLPANHGAFRRSHAVLTAGGIEATGEPGNIMYGPSFTLPKGHYTVRWLGSYIESPGDLAFDVAANGGKTVLAERRVGNATLAGRQHAELLALDITLASETPNVELRAYSGDGAKVALETIVIEKHD